MAHLEDGASRRPTVKRSCAALLSTAIEVQWMTFKEHKKECF